MNQSQEVLNAALQLSENDRAAIAEQLLATLSPILEEHEQDQWETELDRRLEEYGRDPSTAVPWSELKKQQ